MDLLKVSHGQQLGAFTMTALGFEVMFGGITVTGSLMAFAKLSNLVTDPNLITGGYIFRRDRASSDGTTALPVGMNSHTPGILNAAQTTYLTNYINAFNNAPRSQITFIPNRSKGGGEFGGECMASTGTMSAPSSVASAAAFA